MQRNKRLLQGAVITAGVLIGLAAAVAITAREPDLFGVLPSTAKAGKQAAGVWLIPTSQLLHPWGAPAAFSGRPVDLALDEAHGVVAVLNSRGVIFFDAASGAQLAMVKSRATSYAGIAYRPGGRELWASEVTRPGPDGILMIHLNERGLPQKEERVALAPHPLPVGIAFDATGATAYVAFSRSNVLAVIDAAARKVTTEIPVGVAPFGVVVRGEQVFVSNRGGRRPQQGDTLAPTAGTHIASDPATGSVSTGTVSVVNPRTKTVREVAVGLAPSAMALSPDGRTLAVPNAHEDTVTLVDTASLQVRTFAAPAYPQGTRGTQPLSPAWSPDGKTLYVACGGLNAIAAFHEGKLAGAIPTGWFPSAVAVSRDGALRVVNIKGTGNTDTGKGAFKSTAYEGTLLNVPAPTAAHLQAGLREVKLAAEPKFTPAGGVANLTSLGIEHVFFIIKENRTYDQVFGDLPQGNGDPKLVMYGREVTPNHHALAERFVLLDNFYTSSSISFDGHQWLMMAFVSEYTQRAFAASPRGYAWDMSDALTVSPLGFFWQGAPRPPSVRIYGEFCLPARWDPARNDAADITDRGQMKWLDYWKLYKEGKWQTAVGCSAAGVPALKSLMSVRYPFNETVVTDQIRAEEFVRELAEHERSGKMENINIITLTSDHTNGTNPASPRPASMVADNDLALGRIVEAISRSRFWAKSLILVVEDDAQDGLDHVDGHRTVALAIGPHVRRAAVDSNHYTQLSMVRTIQELFRIPQRTAWLRAARAMSSVFTPQADTAPYKALPNRIPLDDMNPPIKALSGRQLWAARASAAINWRDVDDVPSDTLNRILWGEAKGWEKPYPARGR